jgi:DNA-binding NtrC family response regulator
MAAPELNRPLSTTAPRAAGRLTVLSLSPHDDDHLSLQAIVDHSTWMLLTSRDFGSATTLLQQHDVSVILCAQQLRPGTWIDVLDHISTLPNAPSLIVASKTADERLWAEALNLGAWDVLAKPFDRREVIRSVKSGWQHCHDLMSKRAAPLKRMRTAG